ncbi:MAG: hypothetical protein LBM61_02550 [Prevotellaceae bacterium]|jgi:hypothetical protein|nr:hypothetical protein [Prevotellaceae bacterium]
MNFAWNMGNANTNSKLKGIKVIATIAVILVILAIVIFIIYFPIQNQYLILSNRISDWGSFGSYIGGIINPILAGLNIYIFYVLTKTATEFGNRNVQKQLSFSTGQEYQKKINDLMCEIIKIVGECNEIEVKLKKRSDAGVEIEDHERTMVKIEADLLIARAIQRLHWMKTFAESFVKESEPLIPKYIQEVIVLKGEFLLSIDKLIESKMEKPEALDDFFKQKSVFINEVFGYVVKS